MPTPAYILPVSRVCQYLIANDIAKKRAMKRGAIADNTDVLINLVQEAIQSIYDQDPNYAGMQVAADYLHWLCGPYEAKAVEILALNNTGNLAGITTISGTTIQYIHIQLIVGVDIAVGATNYTIDYTRLIPNSVRVELPQDNIPESQTNQFSYTLAYSESNVIVNFTNDDGSGNNLGVQDGMLFIITGARIALASANGSIPSATYPKGLFFTGADLDVDNKYINTAFDGFDTTVEQRGVGTLRPGIEASNLPGGGTQILGGGTYTSEDVFYISVNFGE